MTGHLNQDQISKLFKELFATKIGLMVLDRIKLYCLANSNQNMADPKSTNQTFYNLGAYSVYRYIQYQIDMKPSQSANDCVIEIEDEQGE